MLRLILSDSTNYTQGKQRQIFAFIHQLFIDTPLLIKLVLFQVCDTQRYFSQHSSTPLSQGFDPALVDVVVEEVASMHTCLDFVSELLLQPSLEKQV